MSAADITRAAPPRGRTTVAPEAATSVLRRSLREPRMRIGMVLFGLVMLMVIVGPFVAPHSQGDLVGAAFAGPSSSAPLGTDYLGEDVLSRVLEGGGSIVWISFVGTTLGVAAGAAVGLTAAYSRSYVDEVLMRAMDVLLAFPVLVLVLLFVSIIGPQLWLMPLVLALAWTPQVARVAYGAGKEIAASDFVESAETLGSPRRRIVRREILPNIMTPLMVDFGLRLTWSVGIVTAMSFLGAGLQPPSADWGLMIKENYPGLTLQPWGVVIPILCIAVFTFGTNLMTEGFARAAAGITPQRGPS